MSAPDRFIAWCKQEQAGQPSSRRGGRRDYRHSAFLDLCRDVLQARKLSASDRETLTIRERSMSFYVAI
jgi:hypothetical protein